MTKCIKRIRDLFQYALYKFTLYLLTYLLTDRHCQLLLLLPNGDLRRTMMVDARCRTAVKLHWFSKLCVLQLHGWTNSEGMVAACQCVILEASTMRKPSSDDVSTGRWRWHALTITSSYQ